MDWEDFYNNFRKPDFIPGYEIQNRLGGGAFGDVYKARKQSIGKAYAIKFLKIEDESQREAVERELAQVRHFAAIDHPNLVTIEDMGTVMDVPYLIMGYAGEDTLARRLKAGALERGAALSCFTQACRGVLALHDRRLVHFDLKPSNVFLKGEVARVGDYGLSKLLTDGRTTLSFGRGTPHYMAPEMLRNRADHRADLYSLGVMLYESLCGRLPFLPEDGGSLILREHDEPPEFPSDFPARVRPVVERCLRLDPADRFEGVGELLGELGQTARQGDSVAYPWAEGEGAAPRTEGAQAEAERAAAKTRTVDGALLRGSPEESLGELRSTAAELARGAVEVARGMWEGLRQAPAAEVPGGGPRTEALPGAKRRARAEAPLALAPPAAAAAIEAPEVEPPRAGPDSATASTSDARSLHDAARSRARRVLRAVSARRPPSGGAVLTAPQAGAQTVPVPPRVQGGAVGTLLATLLVGIEVLVSLLAALGAGGLRLLRLGSERLTRRSDGGLRRARRLALFLIGMALLGATAVTVAMVVHRLLQVPAG